MITSTPPSPALLAAALSDSALSPDPKGLLTPLRLFHLLTPITEAPGIQIQLNNSTLSWRRLAFNEKEVSRTALPRALPRLRGSVSNETSPSEKFLDLAFDPVHWVKPIRSGSRIILFGTDLLFGLPRVSLDLAVPLEAVPGILRHILSKRPTPTGPLATLEMDLLITGDQRSLLVSPRDFTPPPSPPYPSPEAITALGAQIAKEIDGKLLFYVDLEGPGDIAHVEYIIHIEGYEALVAAYVDGNGAASIGYPGQWDPTRRPDLKGWNVDGTAASEPGVVATHATSHLRALIRPALPPYRES